jgi:YgiT-type zinc finger domain-containing protein
MSRTIDTQAWMQATTELTTAMAAWRLAHPKATLRQIEEELDTRLMPLRARMVEDMALASAATDWQEPTTPPPVCPDCGQTLVQRSRDTRILQTHGGQDLTLQRGYGVCPACGVGLFPPR